MIQEFQDTITGNGSVQIESNMELGTGGTTPSSWTGIITVAQNSSLRMDGGITVTGAVKLTQASNGFFNISNGGQNIVTGGVSCPRDHYTQRARRRQYGRAHIVWRPERGDDRHHPAKLPRLLKR